MLDLHSHTTASDGALSPTQLVERAHRSGVRVLAVTDHDTLAGLPETREAGARLGVEIVPGVEISATRAGGGSLHILGYFFDESDPGLARRLAALVAGRDGRNESMARRLTELGLALTLEEVKSKAKGVVGRPHFAQVMVEKGYVSSYEEAFDRWLGEGRPAYADKEVLTPKEAVDALHGAGGIAVLAHPLVYAEDPIKVRKMLGEASAVGMDGVEVYYGSYSAGHIGMLRSLADQQGLLASGGSDFHRDVPSSEPGEEWARDPGSPLPRACFDALAAQAQARRSRRVS